MFLRTMIDDRQADCSGKKPCEAIRKMKMALSELTIDGIDINRDLLAEILSDEQFVSGEYTTDFMAEFEEKHADRKK